jgi:transcription elongation GreA/GreB family factor
MSEKVLMSASERVAYQRFLEACEERILREARHLSRLQVRLERSSDAEGGPDAEEVAQLHSRVRLRDLSSGKTHIETVVLPAAPEVLAARRPLDSWIGPLLLGARAGDQIRWHSSDAIRQWRIEEILAAPAHPNRVLRRRSVPTRRSEHAADAHISTAPAMKPKTYGPAYDYLARHHY